LTKFLDLARLDGRVALITGACGHVGRVVAQTLSDLGAGIVVVDLDSESCDDLGATLSSPGRMAPLTLPGNIANQEYWQTAPATIEEALGRLDIVVHCAAFVGTTQMDGWAVPFSEQTTEAWNAAMDVNISSFFTMVRELQPLLDVSGRASVISVSSIYGMVGPDMRLYEGLDMANPAAYAASKGGLIQLTRHLATVLAPRIRVNALSPGGLNRNQPEAFQQRYVERTPLQRMGREEDLIGAVGFLASDLSSYVTGVNLPVDGGWTAW
jgi:NAD(P)-dependent dehydrogenase (short-subunit alcohol dehydrogenase family)